MLADLPCSIIEVSSGSLVYSSFYKDSAESSIRVMLLKKQEDKELKNQLQQYKMSPTLFMKRTVNLHLLCCWVL